MSKLGTSSTGEIRFTCSLETITLCGAVWLSLLTRLVRSGGRDGSIWCVMVHSASERHKKLGN
ncbi:hypothetical protein K461DRAFT_280619 [Myriangium duriaei CBS 260.36]|uniref:Uncharacterized protein n=1 Tax=Myriangium duriaei CBS 260.36 TaxID=1168546 RepID=A0A9P4MKB3_9PEZI|nr:hypothetical protein K461DRAFT_280619 [Myriangium duriaei CBS 260.36]